MSSSIFREKGIYGKYGHTLTERDAYLFGKALGRRLTGHTLAIGGDVRLSTITLKEEVIKGLITSGCAVMDAGILPVPALAFAGEACEASAIVMVTASPRPARYNGFKVYMQDGPLSAEGIAELKLAVTRHKDFIYRGGRVERIAPMLSYLHHLESAAGFRQKGRIVLDCGHGVCSAIAPRLFLGLGYTVVERFTNIDGAFPDRNPALTGRNIAALGRAVAVSGATLGIAFDDDGDELALIGGDGREISRNACGRFCSMEQTAYGCNDALLTAILMLETLNSTWLEDA